MIYDRAGLTQNQPDVKVHSTNSETVYLPAGTAISQPWARICLCNDAM